MQDNQDFISLQSLGTFSGASFAVWILSNTLRMLFDWNSRWPPFFVSMIISFIAVSITETRENIITMSYFGTAILNGCLLFLNSLGLQTAMTSQKPTIQENAGNVRWFTPW